MAFVTYLALSFVVVGVLLLLAEVSSPGMFLIVPATVLLILGGIGLVYPDLLLSWWAPIAAVIILIPTTLVTIKLYQRLAPPAPPETVVASSLIGKKGVVQREVSPGDLKGKVRIDHDSWSATADDVIPEGRRVVVVGSEGVHVVVREIKEEAKGEVD